MLMVQESGERSSPSQSHSRSTAEASKAEAISKAEARAEAGEFHRPNEPLATKYVENHMEQSNSPVRNRLVA